MFDIRGGDASETIELVLAELQPGVWFPNHRHRGREASLVLEGGYKDSTGTLCHAGNLQIKEAGSEHSIRALPGEPCVVAGRFELGFEFTAWPLRWLAKLAGK
jgi:putative transcriptional regulator